MTAPGKNRVDEFVARPQRAIWTLAAPMMMGFLTHAVYSIVDTIFIGQISAQALAAATYVGALFFFAIALINGIATGITAMVAQAVGRRSKEDADRTATNGLVLALIVGVLFAIIGLLGGRLFIPALGARGEAAELAWDYFFLIAAGMPLFFVSSAIRSVLTGEGDAKTPMIVLAAATLINICLDPVFIFVLDMGITGAALSTIVAQLVALSLFTYLVLVRRRTFVNFRLSYAPLRWAVIGPVVRIGIPAAAGQLVMALGMTLTNRVLAHFGQTAVAGYGAGGKVDMLVALPLLGIAGAAVSVIGMFQGAGRMDLVRYVTLYTYRVALTISVAMGVGAYLASDWVIGLFTDHPEALAVGGQYLAYMVFAYPLMAFGMTTGRILQGLGHGVPALVITAMRVLIVGIPSAYLAVYVFDAPIEAVWLSFIAGGVVSNIMALAWVRALLWKTAISPGRGPKSRGRPAWR